MDIGYNGTEFKFDGVDDYIEVYTEKDKIEEGITFEFYCKSPNKDWNISMIGKTKKNDSHYANKFRMQYAQKKIYCCMSVLDSMSDWKSNTTSESHWIVKELDGDFAEEKGGYVTVTADIKNNIVAVYWDGNFLGQTSVSHEWMVNGSLTDSSIPFSVGMIAGGSSYNEQYSNIDLYACRLYNKVLNADEVKDNYNKTVAYHNLLVQEETN